MIVQSVARQVLPNRLVAGKRDRLLLDLWVHQWRKRHARCEVIVVRYADDFVLGFQFEDDAVRFRNELSARLKKFSLSLHGTKTRLIRFGRFAGSQMRERGLGKPSTFNFLGFTHICGKAQNGNFVLLRRTQRERLRTKLKVIRERLMKLRHLPISAQGRWLASVVRGHFAHYGVPTNIHALQAFRTQVERHWPMRYAVGVSVTARPGTAFGRCPPDGSHRRGSSIHGLRRASTVVPEVGAQCASSACWDLCGGRPDSSSDGEGPSLPRPLCRRVRGHFNYSR